MAGLGVLLMLLSVVAVTEAIPAMKVKCTQPGPEYSECRSYGTFSCPSSCPQDCYMDCNRCAPICNKHSPPPPPPPGKKSPPPPWKKLHTPPPPSSHPSPPPPSNFPPPPPSQVSAAKKVRCKNKAYPLCYNYEQTCPSECPTTCEMDCVTCHPVCNCNRPGAVCQDPRFIGGDGLTFYFHGKKDKDFCLVSDSNVHINAHFIGRRIEGMKRDFTWVQSLGILFDTHRLFIGAQETSTWDDSVDRLSIAFDGKPVYLPEVEGTEWPQWRSMSTSNVTIKRLRDTNAVEIEAKGNFKIKAVIVPITEKDSLIHNYGITSENCFAHLDVNFKFYALSGEVTGVLGQTYARNYVSRAKMGVAMPVLGGERKFASSGLFTTDCAASRFTSELSPSNSPESVEFVDLSCASGGDGQHGVVCKR